MSQYFQNAQDALNMMIREEVQKQMNSYVSRLEKLEHEVKVYKTAVVQLQTELYRHNVIKHGDPED